MSMLNNQMVPGLVNIQKSMDKTQFLLYANQLRFFRAIFNSKLLVITKGDHILW